MTRLGILTSGGDAPGMNAAIRAVVRSALHRGMQVIGIQRGYEGLVYNETVPMEAHSVSNIIQRGGTILKTARSEAFMTREGRARAQETINRHGIDVVIAIGGDGTLRGAEQIRLEHGTKIVAVPGTIDNDLSGTDYTIGYDTAVNTAVEAIDKIRDTADAFERTFYIEVMGRLAGFIAIETGLSCGAESVAIPETPTDLAKLAAILGSGARSTKRSNIVVVAEGDEEGGAFELAKKMKDLYGLEYRVCILGHLQRGGNPSARDRVLASSLGAAAVEAVMDGIDGVMVGEVKGSIAHTPIRDCYENRKPVDKRLVELIDTLSR